LCIFITVDDYKKKVKEKNKTMSFVTNIMVKYAKMKKFNAKIGEILKVEW